MARACPKGFCENMSITYSHGLIIVSIGIVVYGVFAKNAGLWVAIWGGIGALAITFVEWKQSKSRKYARTDRYFIYQTGVFRKIVSICFLDRVQSVQLSQSPFDRRWNMATLQFDTAGSGGLDHELKVELLDEEFAHRELQAWTTSTWIQSQLEPNSANQNS